MSDRAYTVREIDALRKVVESKWLYGRYSPTRREDDFQALLSRSYSEAELTRCVEEMVRTHMLAGHTADDLMASEKRS